MNLINEFYNYLNEHFYREDSQEYVHTDVNNFLQLQQSKSNVISKQTASKRKL